MKENYLLKTTKAQQLYLEYAKELPIIDFHNHVSTKDIATEKMSISGLRMAVRIIII